MHNNSVKLIKKLLITSTVLVVATSSVDNTFAVGHNVGPPLNMYGKIRNVLHLRTTNTLLSELITASQHTPDPYNLTTSWLIFDHAGTSLSIDQSTSIRGIDVAKNGVKLRVDPGSNTTIGSISGVANPIEIEINGTLTLSGTSFDAVAKDTYDKLRSINLNQQGRLIIDADIELPQISGRVVSRDNGSIISINQNKSVVFRGSINPKRPIRRLDIGENSKVSFTEHTGFAANHGTAIELKHGSILTVHGKDIHGTRNVTDQISGDADDHGTLVFQDGDSKLDFMSVGTQNSKIHELRIDKGMAVANITLTTNSFINATKINFTDDDTLKTSADVTGKIDNITGIAGKGTLYLNSNNSKSITVTGNIGETKQLQEIKLGQGTDVNFKGTIIQAAAINIGEAAGSAKLSLMPVGNMCLLNRGGTINFHHPDSELTFDGGTNVNSTIILRDNLAGALDNEGKITLSSTNAHNTLSITNSNGKTIGIAANKRIRELTLEGQGIYSINSKVYTKTLTLNNTQSVNFVSGIDQGIGGIINVNNNTTISGNINGRDTTINLNKHTLTYTRDTISLSGDVIINTEINPGIGIGHLVIDGAQSKLDCSHAASVTINLNGTSNLADIGKSYVLIESANGGNIINSPNHAFNSSDPHNSSWVYEQATAKLSSPPPPVANQVIIPTAKAATNITAPQVRFTTVNINDSNQYVKWVIDPVTQNLQSIDVSVNGLMIDFGTTAPEIVQAFSGAAKESDAGDVVNTFGILSKTNPTLQKEAASRLSVLVPTTNLTAVIIDSEKLAHDAIGARIDNIFSGSHIIGAAAGEEMAPTVYGLWSGLLYRQAVQKKQGNASGYKSKSVGGTVGFDGLVNDSLTLGAAYAFVDSTFNHQDQKLGDKTAAKNAIFSIYGIQQLSSNWFIQGITSLGFSKIRNYEKRIISATFAPIAAARYPATTYIAEMLAHYRYMMFNNTMITPTAGLRYTSYHDKGYTETGAIRRNLTVNKKSMHKLEGILGIKSSFLLQSKDYTLIPELHALVNYNFSNKASTVKARLNGALTPMPVHVFKQAKTLINFGTNITLKSNMIEYGIGYDLNVTKKYSSHQGTLKVRVNL